MSNDSGVEAEQAKRAFSKPFVPKMELFELRFFDFTKTNPSSSMK
jgi:hypothetical protein